MKATFYYRTHFLGEGLFAVGFIHSLPASEDVDVHDVAHAWGLWENDYSKRLGAHQFEVRNCAGDLVYVYNDTTKSAMAINRGAMGSRGTCYLATWGAPSVPPATEPIDMLNAYEYADSVGHAILEATVATDRRVAELTGQLEAAQAARAEAEATAVRYADERNRWCERAVKAEAKVRVLESQAQCNLEIGLAFSSVKTANPLPWAVVKEKSIFTLWTKTSGTVVARFSSKAQAHAYRDEHSGQHEGLLWVSHRP